jgi:hypothetical protein
MLESNFSLLKTRIMCNRSIFLTCAILGLVVCRLAAQQFDLTTDGLSLKRAVPNIQLQWTPTSRFGFILNGAMQAYRTEVGDFNLEAKGFKTGAGVRYFPWGRPFFLRFANEEPAYLKKNRHKGCFKKKTTGYGRGLFISMAYLHEQQQALFQPFKSLDSPIAKFSFQIISQGAALGGGYQLRLGPLTLGVETGLAMSNPRWRGTVDIFSKDLYSKIFPVRFRAQHFLRLDAGVHF